VWLNSSHQYADTQAQGELEGMTGEKWHEGGERHGCWKEKRSGKDSQRNETEQGVMKKSARLLN